MAAVTLLGAATFNTSSGTKTVTATPAVNDLIIIVTAHSGNSSAATPTDNQGGTYTAINNAAKASSADRMGMFVRNSLVGSAVSTIYTHAPGASSGGGLAVLKVTGMSRAGSNAVRQSAKQENQAAGTPAPAFGQAPLTSNPVIGAVFNGTNPATLTPRTNFAERADAGYNTPATGLEVMSRDSGETATAQTWGGSSPSAFASLVLELDSSVPPISGTLSKTLDAASSSGSADNPIAGSVSKTLGSATVSAAGTVGDPSVSGSLAKTLGGMVSSAASALGLRGQASGALGAATALASGNNPIAGQSARTLGGMTASAAGRVSLAAQASRVLGSMVSGAVSRLLVRGTSAKTLGAATTYAHGGAPAQATACRKMRLALSMRL